MPNSRLHPRAPFFAQVDVLSTSDALPRRVWGKDLSETGIFLHTHQALHPGARLSLRFDVDEAEVHVRAAEVVWVRPFEPISVSGEGPGVGVRFLSIDPPSRAAIRRFVRGTQERSDVKKNDSLIPLPESLSEISDAPPPAPPPLPDDIDALELAPLSMPPLSMPPLSMPPLAELSSAPPRPAFSASSIGPISLPPFDDEALMPAPDEAVATVATSAPPSTAPEEAHPLAGWRFEVVPEPVPEPAPEPSFSGLSMLGAPVEDPDRPREGLGLAFDDAPPERLALPPHPAALEREEPVEAFSIPPSLLDDAAGAAPSPEEQERLDASFLEGNMSVLELPRAEPRRRAPHRPRRASGARYGWAAGLLAAGGVAGLVAGWSPGLEPAGPPDAAPAPVALDAPAPRPVFVAERELMEAEAPPATPTKTEAPKAQAPHVKTAKAEAAKVEASKSEIAKAEASKAEIAKTEPKEEREPTLASALPPSPAERAPSSPRIEWGRVTLPLEGGRVDRTFTLDSPPRVVVDLVDAGYPGHRDDAIGEKGVARLRIGRPDPSHVRVVVELESGKRPRSPSALKRERTLAIAWR